MSFMIVSESVAFHCTPCSLYVVQQVRAGVTSDALIFPVLLGEIPHPEALIIVVVGGSGGGAAEPLSATWGPLGLSRRRCRLAT